MAIKGYIAMTEAEIAAAGAPAYGLAYMACHFSPYGTGLVNLPRELPEGAMLILNDRIPPRGHDPRQITEQLLEVIRHCGCECVLLDFQQPGCKELDCLAQSLSRSLSCPTAVSEAYAAGLSCPVFLPPVPPDVPLQAHLAPWDGREVWLEISLEGLQIRLTEQGSFRTPLPYPAEDLPHPDEKLHCRYSIATEPDAAIFTLQRTREDNTALLREAETMGVTKSVGLWQELSAFP